MKLLANPYKLVPSIAGIVHVFCNLWFDIFLSFFLFCCYDFATGHRYILLLRDIQTVYSDFSEKLFICWIDVGLSDFVRSLNRWSHNHLLYSDSDRRKKCSFWHCTSWSKHKKYKQSNMKYSLMIHHHLIIQSNLNGLK